MKFLFLEISMPVVDIQCSRCGQIETIESVKWAGENKLGYTCKCPECGRDAVRTIEAGVTLDCEDHPRLSRALGFHPDQIADGTAQRIHPGAEFIKTKGGMYALSIRNRAEKIQRMTERSRYIGKTLHED
jgi:hypothetical protein